jgi:sarcosine oxidase gamma subunit
MRYSIFASTSLMLAFAACGGGTDTSAGGAGGTATTTTSTGGATTSSSSSSGSSVDCSQTTTKIEEAVCAANALLATVPAGQLSQVNFDFGDSAERTKWSNLPVQLKPRAGVQMGSLDAASQAAALALMKVVLSSAGQDTLDGIRAADDYLGTMQGGYGAGLYSIAIFGTPSVTGNWEVLFGGHHMAFRVTYIAGTAYATPNHLGVEPKAEFTQDGKTYAPLADEAAAIVAVFGALSATELSSAYLSGQSFMDVLVGPVEYGTGSSASAKAKYPTGANRTGALVSSLSADKQALVTAAIEGWVRNFEASSIADTLVADYTSAAAFADTYVAFAGPSSTGVDVDTSGTYMRIDGPRVWIEVACQGGVVIQGKTHYHTIYRDKQFDYGGSI